MDDETVFTMPGGAYGKGTERTFARYNAALTAITIVGMIAMSALVWATSRPRHRPMPMHSTRDSGQLAEPLPTDRPSGVPYRRGSPEPGPSPVPMSETRPR